MLSRFCRVQLWATPWTVARQTLLSTGVSRQESRSGLPFPPPGDLPDPGIEPESPISPALAGGFFTTSAPGKPFSLSAKHMGVTQLYPDVPRGDTATRADLPQRLSEAAPSGWGMNMLERSQGLQKGQ